MSKELDSMQELLAHQQHELSRMSDEIYEQQKDIRKLSEELTLLKDSLKSMSVNSTDGIRTAEEEAPPPHY